MRRLLIALAFVACRSTERPAEPVVAPEMTVPRQVVRSGDLVLDVSRTGADRVRGLGAVHNVLFGERVWWRGGTHCWKAHELRVGGLAFPWVEHCTVNGQFATVRADLTARGRSADITLFLGVLRQFLGPPTSQGDGPTWMMRWVGEEIEVSARMSGAARLELVAGVRPEVIESTFRTATPATIEDLSTRPVNGLVFWSMSDRRASTAFIEATVPAPRIRCKASDLRGTLRARFWYGVFESPVWVPVLHGQIVVPWRAGSDRGVLLVEGYEPVAIHWDDPDPADDVWCLEKQVEFVPKE